MRRVWKSILATGLIASMSLGELSTVYASETQESIDTSIYMESQESTETSSDVVIDADTTESTEVAAESTEGTSEATTATTKATEDIADATEETSAEVREAELSFTSNVASDGVTVTISGPESAFPSAALTVALEVKEDDDYIEEVVSASDVSIADYVAYDITLLVDGVEVEPLGEVSVVFSANTLGDASAEVYHVNEETNTLDAVTETSVTEDSISMTTDHFSTYLVGASDTRWGVQTTYGYIQTDKDPKNGDYSIVGEIYYNGQKIDSSDEKIFKSKTHKFTAVAAEGYTLEKVTYYYTYAYYYDNWSNGQTEEKVWDCSQSFTMEYKYNSWEYDEGKNDYRGYFVLHVRAYFVDKTKSVDVAFTTKNSMTENVIQGVSFSLAGEDGTTYTATSDSSGDVSFSGIPLGTYTLTENQLMGYETPNHTWTVTVTETDTYTIVSDSTEEADLEGSYSEGYVVWITPQTEPVVSTDKDTDLYDWDNRIYQVKLEGSAMQQVVETASEPVNVVLVLDMSGSMLFPNDLTNETTMYIWNLDTSKTYYYIVEDEAGTVYTVQYRTESGVSGWYYKDSSYVYANSGQSWTLITDKSSVLNYYKSYKFYTSPSVGASIRLQDTKAAAESFIKTLAEANEKNQVAIVTFAKSTSSKTEIVCGLTELSESNVETLLSEIEGLSTDGGTNQYAGLELANSILTSNTESATDHSAIVLISDGTINENVEDSYKETQISTAQSLATVYTVGIDINVNATVKEKASTLLKEIATDENRFYEVGSDALHAILSSIAVDILGSIPLTATVVDYIDERFQLVDTSGNALSVGDTISARQVTDGKIVTINGTIGEDENGVYVKWESDGLNGFIAEFYVQAKEDFLGGYVVKTNELVSNITATSTEGEIVSETFPVPTVNVKLLDLSMGDLSETLFLGDEISSGEFAEALNETILFNETNGSLQLTVAQIATLMETGTVEVPYSYGDTNDAVGTLTYTLTCSGDTASLENHTATVVGDNVETYTLKVSYTPYTLEARKNTATTAGYVVPNSSFNGHTLKTSKETSGKYVISVVAGTITITKTISKEDYKEIKGDPIFTFQIKNTTTGDVYYKTLRFTSGVEETNGNYTLSVVLTDMKRGIYEVTELSTMRFTLDEVTISSSQKQLPSKSMENGYCFAIGYSSTAADTALETLAYKDATISFVNSMEVENYFSDTDVVVNTYRVSDGKVISGAEVQDRLNGSAKIYSAADFTTVE